MITDVWSLGYTPVTGDEDIDIGGQRLRVIFAPVLFHVHNPSWFAITYIF